MQTNDLIADGADALHSGDLKRAAQSLGRALKQSPKSADAHHLLGLVAHRLGHHSEAVALITRATALDRRLAPAWNNRALPLLALGEVDEAERSLKRALKVRRDFPAATLQLARLELTSDRAEQAIARLSTLAAEHPERLDAARWLVQALNLAGRSQQAVQAAVEALTRHPDDPRLLGGLGQGALDLGQLDQAMAAFTAAAERSPDLAAAAAHALASAGATTEASQLLSTAISANPSEALYLERGQLRLDTGDREGAHTDWRAAAELGSATAQQNLAVLHTQQGEPAAALPHILAALALPDAGVERWTTFCDVLATIDDPGPSADTWLLAAWARADLDHQRLERATRHAIARAEAEGLPWTSNPLFVPWLSKSLARGSTWEARLVALRTDLLADGPVALRQAVALQAWWTEFVWPETAEETTAVEELTSRVTTALAAGSVDASQLAALAMYRPLGAVPALVGRAAPEGLGPLWTAHLDDPAREARIAEALDVIAMSDDHVSEAVRAQYEERPYPRLVGLQHKPPVTLRTLLAQLLPHVAEVPAPEGKLQVLIAGCGTGQQAISAATRYADSELLAIDLSRASIACAARRAADLGLDNIRFAQADILALGVLPQRFHVVECGGVLHHLADPMAGWRVLVDRTEPGGLMKIGLYSELGRRDVVAARAAIADWGLPPTPAGLREARLRLRALPEGHPARGVIWSPDFTSLSGLRDLVMHEMEHRFTISQLRDSFDALGLDFLGFQHPMPQVAAWYRQRFPDDPDQCDLDRWQQLEEDRPKAFSGMYQFWVRRRAD